MNSKTIEKINEVNITLATRVNRYNYFTLNCALFSHNESCEFGKINESFAFNSSINRNK